MSAAMTLTEYALFSFGSLFLIVDPIAAVPAFLSMTARDSVAQRIRMAQVACLATVGILAVFACVGQGLFLALGVSLPALQAAGGLVLLLVALDMLRAQRSTVQETAEETAAGARKEDIAITPLAIPMMAGPGAISAVILLESQAADWTQRVVLLGCIVAIGIVSYITLALAGRGAAHWLGPIAEKIITRLMGLLLAALAIQFIFNALKSEQGLLGR
jgi:multiple antibiotic resistance protein